MKLLVTHLIVVYFLFTTFQGKRQDIKLEGKYKMEYETEYSAHNCFINIRADKYTKSYTKGAKKKGEIETLKHKFGQRYVLREKGSNLEVYVEGTTYRPSDTIYFRTRRVDEKDDGSALTIYSGKLIKIK
jgi:hypothetical protein